MLGLRTKLLVVVLIALALGVAGENRKHVQARQAGGNPPRTCTNNPQMEPYLPPCSTTSITGTTTATTTTASPSSNSSDPTALERAHWCRFGNGTYAPLGYTYLNTQCSMCQCTSSRAIRCQALECMPTYCIDNTMPIRKSGQCCTQCGYDAPANSCVYNGIPFPHGTVLKSVENQMQCWCQLGNIECRQYIGSIFQGIDFWSDGKAVYIIVIILCVVLIFGLLLCCGCTLYFYYYYQRNQHTFQQAYDQYLNTAGWQPMNEEEQYVTDPSAEEKRLEAEKNQSASPSELIPPPYAVYNNSYVPEEEQKHM
jgi:hypothetical protein